MIQNTDYRLGNYVQNKKGEIARVELLDIEYRTDKPIRAWFLSKPAFGTDSPDPIPLTKEIASKLGFEVTDLGDFWEFQKGDFIIVQMKKAIGKVQIDPVYVLHSKKSKYIKVPYVHTLQNLYFAIEKEELKWT